MTTKPKSVLAWGLKDTKTGKLYRVAHAVKSMVTCFSKGTDSKVIRVHITEVKQLGASMNKKYTVWVDYGCEGWVPNDYDTLQECIDHESYGSPTRITQDVQYEIVEKESQ